MVQAPSANTLLRVDDAGPGWRRAGILVADVAGSTGLAERIGDEGWARVLRRYRDLACSVIGARNGEVVGTPGDAVLGAFSRSPEAVACGTELRELLSGDRSLPPVRLGAHAGELLWEDSEVIGRVVNVACRVAAEAAPGEFLVTESVLDEVRAPVLLEDRGLRRLRGMAHRRHLLAVVGVDGEGDGGLAPGAAVQELPVGSEGA